MGKGARQALANRTTGCLVCDAWNDEMIALVDHGARICRPCVTRIGRAILTTNPTLVAQLWPRSPAVGESRREAQPTTEVDVEKVFAELRVGVAKQISADDAVSHFELAVAYGEMGLMADAIREAATALGERAPLIVATRAVNWLFAPDRAHADALRTVARTLRSE